jgi:hypothetical protein
MNTTKNATRSYGITAGPNKDTLFDACKYAYSDTANVTVNFSVALGYTAPKDDPGCAYIPMPIADIIISEIAHEDGSGESFNLRGYCKAVLDTSFVGDANLEPYRFEAYYNTKRRKGVISFTK